MKEYIINKITKIIFHLVKEKIPIKIYKNEVIDKKTIFLSFFKKINRKHYRKIYYKTNNKIYTGNRR